MSKSLYTTIVESVAPTTETIGVVGQFYLDTTTKKLYQCVEVDEATPSYTWQKVGGSGKTKIYSGGESFAVGSTYTFNQAVSSYSTIELVLRNNGYNSTEYVKLQVVPSGSNCMIHILDYNNNVLNQVNLSFTENTMTVNSSLTELSAYDSWKLLKVYLYED